MAYKKRHYINPLTDFGFKKVFGNEDIMCEFLNDMLEPKSPFVKVTFLDKEMPPETRYERGIIYDMRCRLESGEEVIVEMQNRSQDYFKDRICYYLSRAISSQGDRGDNDWKFQIHAVYGVFFMNFHLKEEEKAELQHDISHIELADVETHAIFSDKMQLWLIELPRYRQMTQSDCKTYKDYWLYNITHLETMDTAVPFQSEKPIFHKLENMADMAQLTREECEHYHISLDSYRTNLAVMDHERNVGIAEGIAKGRAEGRAEGRVEGRAEGERNVNVKHVKAMVAKGLSPEQIANLLDLDVEFVKSIL